MNVRALVAAAGALLWLAALAAAAPADPRADAIERILPGQGIRLHTSARTIEGSFITNRSDSLFLHEAAGRIALPYSEIRRIEVREPARSKGALVGMLAGAVGLAIAASANDADAFAPAIGGAFLGGFLGGLIAGSFDHWHRIYDAPSAPSDSAADSSRR